ncbi:MAG: S41 family peptidase [Phycisphaerae bacterium]|nr:S41 family peptidase [Phycisphaerae bacterium]
MKNRYSILLLWLIMIGLSGCQSGGQPGSDLGMIETPEAETTKPGVVEVPKAELVEPNYLEIPRAEINDSNIVKTACELIAHGKFDAAGEVLLNARYSMLDAQAEVKTQLDQLVEIVQEYKDISERRRLAREATYAERLAELEKLKVAAETDKVDEAKDVSDVNDISKALSAIAKVGEFADEEQKAELLSEPFTQQTFQRAIDKAGALESKGKWIDAYAICYSWLQVIDEENETYSDHADQLIEKAEIAASFQDSPCESREERYEGIKKEMFVRAMDALKFNYVSSIIDYRQMAIKAVKRCKLLAEVMSLSDSSISIGGGITSQEKLSAWLSGLAAISDEVSQSPMEVNRDKFIEIFEEVLALNTTTVELSDHVLVAQFAEASLAVLDPYTIMVWPKQVDDFEKMMTNEFTGIGIEISREKGLLTVVSLLPGTPAYNSGLDADDVIEKVNDLETKDMSLSCAVKNITGPAGTEVKLLINRPGEDKARDITITRAKIIVPTIRGWQRTAAGQWLYMIDNEKKIGYIRITSFTEKTVPDLEEVLDKLEAEGLKGLILDLRFNSGGLLSSAIEMADDFLEEGPIVITRPRSWVSSTYAWAHKEGTHPNYPLVILINSYSASASEIVAGALADPLHNRAILVGERTHGKGSVQGIISYPRGGAQLKYTMAYYYLPSGQRVKSRDPEKKGGEEDWGVGPNVEVKLRSDELKKMFDVQRDNDVLAKAGHNEEAAPLNKHIAAESLSADPQLAIGVLVIKSKMIQAHSEN